MPSLFASLAAVAGATVDAVFSEGFVLLPQSDAAAPLVGGVPDRNGRLRPSAVREVFAFVGTFVAPGAVLHAHGRSLADSTTRPVVGEKPMIDVAVAALPRRPEKGDLIRRDETGETFEVTRFVPEDLGRAWIHLAERRHAQVGPV
ncbi:hypothetical protein [uncultured Methylobacterium sp.]|uniref:hypothetical protein n=1 Tax=uncultured Methylobacterium sp. TaxID=157278 RepID=UPI0035CA991E